MGLNDIQPWKNAVGNGPGIEWHRMDGGETFVAGEPVTLGADGDLNECGDAPTGAQFLGIALAPASYSIGGTAVTKNPRTGANFATGDLVPVAVLRPGDCVISNQFATGGAGVAVTPTLANALGETAGLTLATGEWSIDTGSAQDDIFRIKDVLDANKNSLQDPLYSANTGVYVVAECIQSQSSLTGDPPAS